MEKYANIIRLINEIDIENNLKYKECVKEVAEITAFDEYNIPFLWDDMLYVVMKSCDIKIKYDTKQAVSNWIDATSMWNPELHAPVAKEGLYPFPISGDYYDFRFSRELGYLSHIESPYLKTYIQTIALFEILRYYVKEKMLQPCYDMLGRLTTHPAYFEEHAMWEIIMGICPVDIDWNFYDLDFDGRDFVFRTENQSRELDKILVQELYRTFGNDGSRYHFPAHKFIVGSKLDKEGVLYSADGRVLLRCTNKELFYYKVHDRTCVICENVFPKVILNHLIIPPSVVLLEPYSYADFLRTERLRQNEYCNKKEK